MGGDRQGCSCKSGETSWLLWVFVRTVCAAESSLNDGETPLETLRETNLLTSFMLPCKAIIRPVSSLGFGVLCRLGGLCLAP